MRKIYRPIRHFFSLLNNVKYFKYDFFRSKKFYHLCLLNLRVKPLVNCNIKLKFGIEDRFAAIIHYWQKLLERNTIQYYNEPNRPI